MPVNNNSKSTRQTSPASKRRFNVFNQLSDQLPMGPRKKSKSNNKAAPKDQRDNPEQSAADAPSKSPRPETPAAPSLPTSEPLDSSPGATRPTNTSPNNDNKPSKLQKKNWYGGSWRSKGNPTSEIAKESASVGNEPSETKMKDPKQTPQPPPQAPSESPRNYLSTSSRRSSKAVPAAASISKLTVSSDSANTSRTRLDDDAPANKPASEVTPPLPPEPSEAQKKAMSIKAKPQKEGRKETAKSGAGGSIRWYGWWSKPDGDGDSPAKEDALKLNEEAKEEAKSTPLPGTTPTDAMDQPNPLDDVEALDAAKDKQKADAVKSTADGPSQSSSWFWNWSSNQNSQNGQPHADENPGRKEPEMSGGGPTPSTSIDTPNASVPPKDTQPKGDSTPRGSQPKPSGWAFWSHEKPKSDSASDSGSTHKQVGEIAVADTPSQNHPEAAQFNEHDEQPPKEPAKAAAKSIRGRKSALSQADTPSQPSTPAKGTPSQSPTRKAVKEAVSKKAESLTQAAQAATARQNLVLPEFHTTYSLAETPSYWQQIRSYFLGPTQPSPHLHIQPNPPRIKKALAIGVHGYFPSPLFQKVLGQPTGTSIRFANSAVKAIKDYTERKGYECEIEKVALEGEGFITDRVDTLWKLLLNWTEQIRRADFILVACHSQGVPVAIMLLAKLLQFGCVDGARIGVCAMAGVNLGPFPEYKTRFFGGTALELFEFSNPKSNVSLMYEEALEVVLGRAVRILYIGSIDDQLVSLESSTFSPLSHPYLYRGVFVDGRLHAADFITHLVSFTLKLRNLGIPDHGLIRELSPALAGSLYTGEGHSRIYDDHRVYDLAVLHALETTDIAHKPPAPAALASTLLPKAGSSSSAAIANMTGLRESVKSGVPLTLTYTRPTSSDGANQTTQNPNPYYLPWAMRGLLEEEFVKKELSDECRELLEMFEEWKPVSKGLKDVKWRLEVLKSKL
ncbi:hypothetical protein K402DRAFT_381803 [Aulographum hederae CBS 113979]|uniref:YMC020W-like alpha/beta hydrolase domain-containing protein n=1 Tax=Aulographum hederae CBS 113979 TaxID=1176131 RepID=A0A6G1GSH6_9PEZI|nr:hypothetical protein K402DRAFT_381803 [Aulographum hederae CBS 113979]